MLALVKKLPAFQDGPWRANFKKAMLLGAFFHLLAVILSEGFHRPDEHLGIMRFVGHKIGLLSPEQAFRSWEYPAQIRPWLQPFLYAFFLKPFQLLGLSNSFHMATLLRLVSASIGFLSSIMIAIMSFDFAQRKEVKAVLLYSSFLLWFMPFVHARTSAENLSSSFFIFALFLYYVFHKNSKSLTNLYACFLGALLSITFILRYQMCINVFFLCLWMLVIAKDKIKTLTFVTVSFFVVLAGSSLIDYWGYGTWTNPAYNYFIQNIVHKKAQQFGVDPWWKYLTKSLTKGVPPVSVVIFLASLYYWVKKPKALLTWVTLPFLIVHSFIAHKELRFLFPIFFLLPLTMGLFLDVYLDKLKKYYLWQLTLVTNFVVLLVASAKPVYSMLGVYKYVYESPQKIEQLYTTHPIRDQLYFYQQKDTLFTPMPKDKLAQMESIWVFTDNRVDYEFFEKLSHCGVRYASYPTYLIDNYPKLFKRSKIAGVYYCDHIDDILK